jgi:hypothetical protein
MNRVYPEQGNSNFRRSLAPPRMPVACLTLRRRITPPALTQQGGSDCGRKRESSFDRGHDRRPAEQTPGAPAGMTASDVNERSDIAIYLPPGKLPASRSVILDYLRDTGRPTTQ